MLSTLEALISKKLSMAERKIILPGNDLGIRYRDYPVIFLTGPIGNAPKWHRGAIDYLRSNKTEKLFCIASPHEMIDSPEGCGKDFQIDWEQEFIPQSRVKGVKFFGLLMLKQNQNEPTLKLQELSLEKP